VEGIGDVKRLSVREGYRMRVSASRVLFDRDPKVILAIYV